MARFCVVVTLAMCCLVTGSSGSDPVQASADWLNSTCSYNRDCPTVQSSCVEGQCLCIPGYYYSVGQNTCVEGCEYRDLQKTFVKYHGGYTFSHDSYRFIPAGADCFEWCHTTLNCRAVNINLRTGQCNWLGKEIEYIRDKRFIPGDVSGYGFYQMMCA